MLNFASLGSEENNSSSKKGDESIDNSLPNKNQPMPPFAGQNNPMSEQRPYPAFNQPQNGYQGNPYYGNGQYPPPPPMNNGYYGAYPPSGAYYDKATHEQLKKMRSVAIGSIVVFFLWLIFLILMFIALGLFAAASITNPDTFSSASASAELAAASFVTVALVFWILFWVVGNLVCGIVGSVRASGLSKKVDSFNTIMILYIIGIFIPIIQVVAAFMAISKIKKISI